MVMNTAKQIANRHKLTALSLLLLCVAVYALVFRGDFISIDEMLLFDMTESVVQRGTLDETLTYSLAPQRTGPPTDNLFRSNESYEPLQPLLAAPLFWVGTQLPNANLMHLVWLFNVVVVALVVVLFWVAVQVMGYDNTTAWLSAVLLGFGTLMMPYARTFFREPLMTLWFMLALVMALKIRTVRGRLPWLEAVVMLVAVGLGVATKGVMLLLVPALGVVVFRAQRRDWLMLGVALALGVVALLMIEQTGILGSGGRFSLERLRNTLNNIEWQWVSASTRGYLYSPGRSFFLFSPILLLSPWGMWLLWRRGEWRLVMAMLGTWLLFAVGYGALRAGVWSGGLSLGPRYLLPLLPLFTLTLPPIIDVVRGASSPKWQRWLVMVVAGVSIGMQVVFSAYSETTYHDNLRAADGDLHDAGIWSIKWSPLVYYVQHIGPDTLDNAWHYTDWWPVVTLGLLLVIALQGVLLLRLRKISQAPYLAVSAVVFVMSLGMGLFGLRDDARFADDVDKVFTTLHVDVTTDDAIVLRNDAWGRLFGARFYDAGAIYSLPFAPGETYGVLQPLVMDGTTAEQAGIHNVQLFDYIAANYDRVWMLTDIGPFHVGARRPIERYVVENYYLFQQTAINNTDRLLGFYMSPSAQESVLPSGVQFGDVLQLDSYALPAGNTYRAGDIVPVAFYFSTLDSIAGNYTISAQIALPEGPAVAQFDAEPVGGFEHMSSWMPATSHVDRRAIWVPQDLAVGTYWLQVVIYHSQTVDLLPVSDMNGVALGDVAVLQQLQIN